MSFFIFHFVFSFFASCHGQNACDGIGATVKRSAHRASLQRPNNPILTAITLHEWAVKSISNIELLYVPSLQISSISIKLESRFIIL